MEIIQIIIVIFALFAFSRSLLRIRDKTISKSEFIFWSCLWLSIIVVALLPETISYFSESLGIEKGLNLIIYASIIFLFYLVFRLYVKIEKNNQNLTKIVREIAKEKAHQKKEK